MIHDLSSPSRFVVSVTGAALAGDEVSAGDARCAQCAGPIRAGEPVTSTATLGESFNSKHDCRDQSSRWICGACRVIGHRNWMEPWSKAFVSADGVFGIASGQAQSHFILHPPKPPYLAFVSDGKMQHLIWRSQITLDPDRCFLRLGDRQLSWSKSAVIAAHDAVRRTLSLMAAAGLPGRFPFSSWERELQSPAGSAVRPNLYRAFAGDSLAIADLDLLDALTAGELWAVGTLISAAEKPPAQPQRLL